MTFAINEARVALNAGEFPAGCVIVFGDRIIASAGNSRNASHSKIAHAELNSIKKAESFLYRHQRDCEIFVTIEPCMMCFGAITCWRFRRVVFGVRDYLAGATMLKSVSDHYSEFAPEAIGGILADETLSLLTDYVARNGDNGKWAGRYFWRISS